MRDSDSPAQAPRCGMSRSASFRAEAASSVLRRRFDRPSTTFDGGLNVDRAWSVFIGLSPTLATDASTRYRTCVLDAPISLIRRCSRCGRSRPVSDFNASKTFGQQFYCRDCQRACYHDHQEQHVANVLVNTKRYHARNIQIVHEHLLAHPCVDCGESDPLVLEFDHVSGKDRAVSRLVQSARPERLMAEIAKCEIRCVNCHMRRTAAQFGWRKSRGQA